MSIDTRSTTLHPQVQAFIDAADPRRPKLFELALQAARAQAAGVAALIGRGPQPDPPHLIQAAKRQMNGIVVLVAVHPDDPKSSPALPSSTERWSRVIRASRLVRPLALERDAPTAASDASGR